ncbi:choice-of-anchor J domain-containing protein [Flavihumibacter sp. CACIAM 22H1]|uniref:T9SS-dependent choice-of-anchor J family protein n=1 Tax=Flavihumibacter sp. CACIAM 22H1 TaxID=1812911 RepID=UPI0007A7DAF7|nr:choice-of-anchor J domain-containing protein [Flavihumibacter sp. CACIAM 22H1]KYP15192.1 MAG: hypothetical protein A1D16_02975 [Flavihumibacter sp. CACIAM 22H1]
MRPLLFLFVLLVTTCVNAQQSNPDRCGTGAVMEAYFKQFPREKIEFEALQRQIKQAATRRSMAPLNKEELVYQIPVVFHVLLPDPALVTDQQLLNQLKTLNTDFGGLNADSSKIPASFKPLFGKSKIRFCLAARNPDNEPSTGINRKIFTGFSQPGINDPVKQAVRGGINAWDPHRFLNIWITRINGVTLGYSFLPGLPGLPENEMGLVLKYQNTGSTGTASAPYNLGRTATHEIGHFLGLQHIWGANENNPSCADSDGIDDTPNQDQANFGDPVFPVTDACTPNAPGILFMNYMDYVNDASMVMFTHEQSSMMESMLANAPDRQSLLLSDGCTPVLVYQRDAYLKALVSPLPDAQTCTGSQQPRLLIRNLGKEPIQAVQLSIQLDGGSIRQQNFDLQLASFSEQEINLPAIDLSAGNHQLQVIVKTVNGISDENPANDTITVRFSAIQPKTLPLAEGFETGNLAVGWSVNTSGKENWRITSLASNSGSRSIYFPNYEFNEMGKKADLLLRPVYTGDADSLVLHFSVATAVYSLTYQDTLEVLVSTDCGASYQSIYKKWSSELAIAPPTDYQFVPSAEQWKHEHLDLSAFRNQASIQVLFRNINQYGNNIYLDDIGLEKIDFLPRDAALLNLPSPLRRICSGSVEPSLLIANQGADTIKSLTLQYQLNNGPVLNYTWQGKLARLQQQLVQLPDMAVPEGLHVLNVWVSKTNGRSDQFAANDTLRKSFARRNPMPLPLHEGFEGNQFPPANWDLFTVGDGIASWSRSALAGYAGLSSALATNYTAALYARSSDLYTPPVSFGNVDSVYLSFRIAAANSATTDTARLFSILLTTDCGQHYQTIYQKSGANLATTDNSSSGPFSPNTPSQWRKDSINLSSYLNGARNFYLVFRNLNNQLNTVYLDEVDIYTKTLPDVLKKEGLLIAPTLFNRSLTVQHYQAPTDLKKISLFSSSGQLVYEQAFNGTTSTSLQLYLPELAVGMYYIRLQYSNRVITKKLLRGNR